MNKLKEMLQGKPYLEKWEDVQDLPRGELQVGMSDLMIANGGWVSDDHRTALGTPACWSFFASRYSFGPIYRVYSNGNCHYFNPTLIESGGAFALKFNLPSETIARSASAEELFGCSISVRDVYCRDRDGKIKTYHTISFSNTRGYGEKANSELSKILEQELKNGKLKKLNRQYSGRMNRDKTFRKFDIYEYQGKEYAYVEVNNYGAGRVKYLDGTPVVYGEMVFIELKPATLVIRSKWEDMPKCINPKGTGKATELVVKMQNAVVSGIPFSKEGSVDYNSDECDLRRYAENEFMQEFFVDDEQEYYTNNNFEEEQQ